MPKSSTFRRSRVRARMLFGPLLGLVCVLGGAAAAQNGDEDADALRARLSAEGPRHVIAPLARRIARAPDDGDAHLTLALALLESGRVTDAARALRRACAASPSLLETPVNTTAVYGDKRDPARRERVEALLADAAKSGAADALFLWGVYQKWQGRGKEADAALRVHDLIAGGDELATRLNGDPVLRPELRARALVEAGRHEAALAEMLLAAAQAGEATQRGKLAALFLSTGHYDQADELVREFLGRKRALERLDLTLPGTSQNWWSYSGVAATLLEYCKGEAEKLEPGLAATVGLAVLGAHDQAHAMGERLLRAGMLNETQRNELDVFIARAERDGPPPHEANLAERFNPAPTLDAAGKLLRTGKLGDAARALNRISERQGDSALLHAWLAAVLLAQGDDGAGAQEMAAWLLRLDKTGASAESTRLKLEPVFTRLWTAEQAESIQARLKSSLASDLANAEVRLVLLVLEIQADDPEAFKGHAELSLLLPGHPVMTILKRALRPGGDQTSVDDAIIPPEAAGRELSAREYLNLGDAAFASGKFDLALRRYLAAGQKDESLVGLGAALLRAAFAVGDYAAAERYLAELLAAPAIDTPDKARSFKTRLPDSYRLRADFDRHLAALAAHCEATKVLEGAWFLRAIVELEAGRGEAAQLSFAAYFKIAPQPRADARLFQQLAERR